MTAEPSTAPEGLKARNKKEMEDILSSIRQIIEEDIEDEKTPAASKAEASSFKSSSFNTVQKSGKEEEVLTLTREIKGDGTIVDQGDGSQKETDMTAAKQKLQDPVKVSAVEAIESVEEILEEVVTEEISISSEKKTSEVFEEGKNAEIVTEETEVAQADSSQEIESLLSEETIKESSEALADLSEITRKLVQKEVFQNPGKIGEYTVEGLMRELLKPMLKEWLDMHLPSLVKWIVTEQIEKMLKQSGEK